MEWTDVWKPPFKYDHYGYVWDRDNVMTFSVDDLTEENDKQMAELCSSIVAALNGEEVQKRYSGLYIKEGCDLYKDGILLGSFRGWGHLTGGLKRSGYEAAQVQDQLIKHVLTKLSGVAVIKVQQGGNDREE
jgi:hypothetical protein